MPLALTGMAERPRAKLLTVGRKLAVLGVDVDDLEGPWHIANPGSFNVPQVGSEFGVGLTVARSLCGIFVYSNGYAADFNPGERTSCPACLERL